MRELSTRWPLPTQPFRCCGFQRAAARVPPFRPGCWLPAVGVIATRCKSTPTASMPSVDIPRFLAECRNYPAAVICGRPVFGEDAPRSRLFWRHLTRFWVWVNTVSLEIPDAMCGFRIYPLDPVIVLLRRHRLSQRMDFDIEILVRLHWGGLPMRWLDTLISYPSGGASHLRFWLDNVLIARVHTLLFFGMLVRLPRLLARRLVGSGS